MSELFRFRNFSQQRASKRIRTRQFLGIQAMKSALERARVSWLVYAIFSARKGRSEISGGGHQGEKVEDRNGFTKNYLEERKGHG